MKHEYTLVGRGKVGWHGSGRWRLSDAPGERWQSCSVSGMSRDPVVGPLGAEYEGAAVYDAMGADEDAFRSFVFKGPIVDASLPAGTIRTFMGPWDGAPFTGDARSFDSVPPDVYIGLLRAKVPGVRFGRIVAGRVEWDTDTRENPA